MSVARVSLRILLCLSSIVTTLAIDIHPAAALNSLCNDSATYPLVLPDGTLSTETITFRCDTVTNPRLLVGALAFDNLSTTYSTPAGSKTLFLSLDVGVTVTAEFNGERRESQFSGQDYTVLGTFSETDLVGVPLRQGGALPGVDPWSQEFIDGMDFTIGRRGCAITALAMALNYLGLNTDPGTLNRFFTLADDYDDHGGLFFVAAVETFGAIEHDSALQFHRTSLSSRIPEDHAAAYVRARLQEGFPVIVGVGPPGTIAGPGSKRLDANGVPGHYVLVVGESAGTFLIQDPAATGATTLEFYGNDYVTRGYVSDPPGDLSSVELGITGAQLLVVDPVGRRTGFDPVTSRILQEIPGSVYARDMLDDDETGEADSRIHSTVWFPKQQAGQYQVNVIGEQAGTFMLLVMPFASDGRAQPRHTATGAMNAGSVSSFHFEFVAPSESTRLFGSGYTFPETATYRATFAIDILGVNSPSGSFQYFYGRKRLNLLSTGITNLSFASDQITFDGTASVNAVEGYTFNVIVQRNPDTIGIQIRKPDGTPLFLSDPSPISGAGVSVDAQ